MIVLSDCLTNKIDEGCLKVANSLTKRLKKADASTMVISFERKPDYSDIHMSLNKFFLNERLCEIMHQKNLFYIYHLHLTRRQVVCVHSFFLFFQEEKREFYSR